VTLAEARQFLADMDVQNVLGSTSLLVVRGALRKGMDVLQALCTVPAPAAADHYKPAGGENARNGVDALFAIANELRAARLDASEQMRLVSMPLPLRPLRGQDDESARATIGALLGLSPEPVPVMGAICAAIKSLQAQAEEGPARSRARRSVRDAVILMRRYAAVEGPQARWLVDQIARTVLGGGHRYQTLAQTPGWTTGTAPEDASPEH